MTNELAARCAQEFMVAHPGEAARVLEEQDPAEIAITVASLEPGAAESLLRRMTPAQAAATLSALPDRASGALLKASDFVQVARWLAQRNPEQRRALEQLLPEALGKKVASVAQYPVGCAGLLMDPQFLTFRSDWTVDQVLARIRRVKGRRITDVLLTGAGERLTGSVSLQSLVGAEPHVPIGSLANTEPVSVQPLATQSEVVERMRTHRLASLPVVDLDSVVIGVLRMEALVEAAESEAHTDLQQMVGASQEERALSSPLFAIKSRLPWLLINLLTAFAAASVVGLFNDTIARFTALAVLMPVVAGQSGNTGAQALAVTSRGLALREVRVGHWLRVVVKELVASLGNGVAVASVTGAAVYVWSGSVGLVVVIASSMVLSMLMAALAGAAIPMLLTALRRDPAVASSIVLTTVTDIAGFFSFLGLATLLADWIQ